MKHILTTTAILIASATAINAQSTETLEQAIYGDVTPYLTSLIENNVEVIPDDISELAYEAAFHWNEENVAAAVAQNTILFNQLTASQSEVNNLTISLAQADAHIETEKANVKAEQQNVIDKQAELDALQTTYDTDTAEYKFKIANLEVEVANANKQRKIANVALGEALIAKMQLSDELDAANLELVSAEAQVDSLMDMLDTVATQRDKAVLDRQAAIDDLATANTNLDLLTTELQVTEIDFNALKTRVVVAGNKPYKVMGDVLQVSKDNNTYSGNSYDIGKISSNTVPTGLYVKDYTEIESIKIKGKYSEFNIATDLRLSKNSGNLAEFNSVIAEVKNAMYNEGYKDGYNDGFEDGYNVGYKDAVSDIKGN